MYFFLAFNFATAKLQQFFDIHKNKKKNRP